MRRSSLAAALPGLRRLPATLALAVAFTGLAVAPSSASTDCTAYWTGAASVDTYDNQWSTAGNWSADAAGTEPHEVPGVSDVVCAATSSVSNPQISGYDVEVAAIHLPTTDLGVWNGRLSIAPDSVSQIQRVSASIDGYVVAGARSTLDLYGILYVSKGGLTAEQGATIHSHAYASIGGSFRGHIVLDGDTTISYANITADGLVNNGTMNLDTWQFGGNLIGRFPDQATPSIINNGTINVSTSRTDVAVDGVDNRGTLAVAGGRIPVTGLANLSDGTLSGPGAFVARTPPTYYPPSELVFETSVTTNAATLRNAPGGSFGSSLDGLVANEGTLDVRADLTVGSGLVNTGTVKVGAYLTAPGYTQTAGSTVASAPDGTATGSFSGDVTIAGGAFGGSTGSHYLNINGSLTLGADATTKLSIDSLGNSTSIGVEGSVTLGGALEVDAAPGVSPSYFARLFYSPVPGGAGSFDSITSNQPDRYYDVFQANDNTYVLGHPAPELSVTSDASTVSESAGTASFTISRVNDRDEPVTVDWDTHDGTGVAETDYTGSSGTVTFQPGETTKTVTVPVLDNGAADPSRTFEVRLSNPANGQLAAGHATATQTVTNDDAPALTSVEGGPVVQGATNQLLTLHGDGFDAATAVTFTRAGLKLVPGSLTVLDNNTLTVRVAAASTMKTGPIGTTVNTGTGDASCASCLVVDSRPVVTSGSPEVLAAGVSKRTVTLTGSGFVDGAKVTVAGASVLGTEFVSPTQLKVTMSVPASRAPGALSLRVQNPDGAFSRCTTCLSTVAAPTLAPAALVARRGTTQTVHLSGSGFAEGLTVSGPTGLSFTDLVVTPTEITATMSVAATTRTATGQKVTVTNPASAGWGGVVGSLLTVCAKSAPTCGAP
jgi:hypothetical protein